MLDTNPTNYFDDVEEAAFSPANFVPGIEPSPDKLLQGRLFGYKDAERYRLGANYEQLPINRPVNEVHNYERDGFMSQGQDGSVNYEPNSKGGPVEDNDARMHGDAVQGQTEYSRPYDKDYYSAAGRLYRLMSPEEKDRLIQTIKNNLGSVDDQEIQVLETRQFYQADPDYGQRVAEALGLSMDQIK